MRVGRSVRGSEEGEESKRRKKNGKAPTCYLSDECALPSRSNHSFTIPGRPPACLPSFALPLTAPIDPGAPALLLLAVVEGGGASSVSGDLGTRYSCT